MWCIKRELVSDGIQLLLQAYVKKNAVLYKILSV